MTYPARAGDQPGMTPSARDQRKTTDEAGTGADFTIKVQDKRVVIVANAFRAIAETANFQAEDGRLLLEGRQAEVVCWFNQDGKAQELSAWKVCYWPKSGRVGVGGQGTFRIESA